MRMQKFLATLASFTLVGALLVGCGQGTAPSGSAATTAASTVVATTAATTTVSSGLATPSTAGKLKVEGAQLLSEAGEPVQLRGVSTHGLAWFPGYVNQDFFSELRQEWNANVVRLAMYTAENGGYCTDGDKTQLMQLIDDGVAYATEADMYVIVDWHVLNENSPLVYKDQAIDFFKTVSAKYASNNNVIYEICNEPNGSTTWADIKDYANEVIPVIRTNDPDALILVGTPTWSQDVDQAAADPLEYDNIMYTLHFYAATHKDDLRNKLVSAHEAGLPIFVSEFGICDASGSGQIDYDSASAWIELLDSYNMSYVCWNLSNKDEASALFKSSCSKTAGFIEDDLSAEGTWLMDVLASDASAHADSKTEASGGRASGAKTQAASLDKTSEGVSANAAASGSEGDLAWQVSKVNSWESDGKTFVQYGVTLTNNANTDINGWSFELSFSEVPALSDSWNGSYTQEGDSIRIQNVDYNATIAAGAQITDIGFIVSGSSALTLIS